MITGNYKAIDTIINSICTEKLRCEEMIPNVPVTKGFTFEDASFNVIKL